MTQTAAAPDRAGPPPLLRIRNLSKSFPGLKALKQVNLDVAAGEVVSVVGQNGSGKSTLVKVLAGIHPADPGAEIDHRELRFIHQDLGLVGQLSTVENLDIGLRLGRQSLLPTRNRQERAAAERAIARFGGHHDVRKPVADISAAERAIVAITRAMTDWEPPDGVLVLDEPTAALGGREVDRLFAAIRRVAAEGAGVVFISHRLDEVLGLSDRVVALRDGQVIADVAAAEVDHNRLISLITGRTVADADVAHGGGRDNTVLQVDGLTTSSLAGVSLSLAAGEIVGVTGLLGSGREQLAEALFGATSRHAGTVTVDGEPLRPNSPESSIRQGLAFVPSDRHRHGAVMSMTVRENLTLPRLRSRPRALWSIDRRAERRETRDWVQRVDLHPPLAERELRLFSGGNQQKIVMAKWLRNQPRALLLDEPTQGVDVGAKAGIHELIGHAAAAGTAVLVSSSDVPELITLCDRVLVLRDGRVAAEVSRRELSEERLVTESLRTTASAAAGEGQGR